MKFRDYDIDNVYIIGATDRAECESLIRQTLQEVNVIDLQFSITQHEGKDYYSALILYKNITEPKPTPDPS